MFKHSESGYEFVIMDHKFLEETTPTHAIVFVQGAGGGGGGSDNANGYQGQGGSAGGCACGILELVPGEKYTLKVGQGGAGGETPATFAEGKNGTNSEILLNGEMILVGHGGKGGGINTLAGNDTTGPTGGTAEYNKDKVYLPLMITGGSGGAA
jgi:hypothetical protein